MPPTVASPPAAGTARSPSMAKTSARSMSGACDFGDKEHGLNSMLSPTVWGALGSMVLSLFSDPSSRAQAMGYSAGMVLMTAVGIRFFAKVQIVVAAMQGSMLEKDQAQFNEALIDVWKLALFVLPMTAARNWLRSKMSVLWRGHVTHEMIEMYFHNDVYYELHSLEHTNDPDKKKYMVKNPDQNITEDVRNLTTKTVSLTADLTEKMFTMCYFAAQLWQASGWVMCICFFAAGLNTVIATFVITPLAQSKRMRVVANEGALRSALALTRVHAQEIAFYQGGPREAARVNAHYADLEQSIEAGFWWDSLERAWVEAHHLFASILPWIVCSAMVFAGDLTLVQFQLINGMFSQVNSGLSAILVNINEIEAVATHTERCMHFRRSVNTLEMERKALTAMRQIIVLKETDTRSGESCLQVENMRLKTPDGLDDIISEDLSFDLTSGSSLLIRGGSGSGKTSLLRGIAGLWRCGSGTIRRLPGKQCVFIAQRPYIPVGTLREALWYPEEPTSNDMGEEIGILNYVGLGKYADEEHLQESKNWDSTLSLGESERVAFARLKLLADRLKAEDKQVIAFLDESTASLDTDNEAKMYELAMKSADVVVSVAHRPTVLRFHKQVLSRDGKAGRWLGPHSNDEYAKS